MPKDPNKHLSKFLSLILRHDPGSIGLSVDQNGWAKVEDIIVKAEFPITPQAIADVVRESDKQRFSLSGDQTRIRANQGHSFPVDLGLTPVTPPKVLYHGTGAQSVEAILAEGLQPMARQHVHLSQDIDTALKVGQRHGKPVVLRVAAAELASAGQDFFISKNGVWLTADVPPDFLSTA